MGNSSSNINVFSRNINNSNINRLVIQYVEDRNNLPSWLRGIPIGDWDVSRVTNMYALFANLNTFNEPLNNWNVSNVTTMYHMFNGCTNFNQPLDNWNVSNVTDMFAMFSRCTHFNQPLNNWNVSNVTEMSGMFRNCTNFNQPLNGWNVSNVIEMERMFQGCTSFNQDLSNWNINSVRNVTDMFRGCLNFNINPNWQLHRSARGSASMFDNTPLQEGRRQQEQPQQQPRRGVAFEIHNAFPELNFKKFMTIITRDNNGASNFKDSTYPLQPLITYINTDTSTTFDDTEKTGLTSDLNGEIKTRLNSYLSGHPETIGNVTEMVQFVMSQGPDYKDPYIRFLTYDCMNAYGPGGTSCTKGVFERVFLINKSVLIPLCSDDASSSASSSESTCKPVYRELLGCFYPDMDLNAIFGEWYAINNLEEGSTSPLANASEEERKENFRIFVLSKVPRADPTAINNYIQKNENTFKTLLIGGRRKRRNRKTKRKTLRKDKRKTKKRY